MTPREHPHYRGVILDVDGTLVDSNEGHVRAWVDALAELGVRVDVARVRPLIGMGGDKVIPILAGVDADSERGKQISECRARIFKEKYLPRVQPFPCVRELLERMRADALALAVASSAKTEELETLLAIARVDDLIETRTSSDDAENSKPDPDVVKAALGKTGLAPKEVVMLGDTPYDIEAAARACAGAIALRCGGRDDAHLKDALAIYDDPADFLAHYDSSPLGRSRA